MNVGVMSAIDRLWAAELLPIKDGLYRADGRSWAARVDPLEAGGLALTEAFDLDSFLAVDPDETTCVMVTRHVELPDGSAHLCCGEGSYGSEGFFGALTPEGHLVWVVYLEESNPFIEVALDGSRVLARSSNDLLIAVDVTDPRFYLRPSGADADG